jgi:hypothetical protein
MAAVVIEIADAVAAALNTASLSMPFVAERLYVVKVGKQDEDADDLATLKVSVVPNRLSLIQITRGDDDFSYVVDIGVQKRVENYTPAVVDPYMRLVEEIIDLFRDQGLPSYPDASFDSVENDPIFVPGHLHEDEVFTSIISLTFKVDRPR